MRNHQNLTIGQNVMRDFSITAKGKRERTGGRTARFFVGTSYTKNAVLREQHFEKINVTLFTNIIRNTFSDTLAQSVNPKISQFCKMVTHLKTEKLLNILVMKVHVKFSLFPQDQLT